MCSLHKGPTTASKLLDIDLNRYNSNYHNKPFGRNKCTWQTDGNASEQICTRNISVWSGSLWKCIQLYSDM